MSGDHIIRKYIIAFNAAVVPEEGMSYNLVTANSSLLQAANTHH